ncbi:DUF6119 family protein [Oceanobacillus longus]|uniref:DUF6119 family protein n=1 Tax=Oceanobacillus longus TaxID=930120 RepID=A0ABV8H2S8_9BACI
MSASNYTIYQLKTDKCWQEIIDEFNEDKEEDKQFRTKNNKSDVNFPNIKEYRLYTRAAETEPAWAKALNELVDDLGAVDNINNSYVLFLELQEGSFVATGGHGYSVIENDKNFDFGMELLSRLIKRNDSVIKKINDRHLVGNVVGGNYLYHQKVSVDTEKGFNKYFSEIYTALPSKTIEAKLGIKIKTKKEDFRFLAKDSIKLSKSLTLRELDIFLNNISQLLKEEGYAINPIYQINKKDPLNKELDKRLMKMLIAYLEDPHRDNGVKIVPFYNVFDLHYIQIGESNRLNYQNEKDIIRHLQGNISFDKEISDLLSIINEIKLIATVEDGEEIVRTLYSHLEAHVLHEDRTYWLRDGVWLYLEREFVKEINSKFLTNITNVYNQEFKLEDINDWTDEDEKEGDFNFGHNELPDVYVLDKILYENIEICDLLVKKEEELFFVHVKDGLGGDTRVLANQIETSMRMLYEGIHVNGQILEDYYNNIIQKIKKPEVNKEESTLSLAARKFKVDFPDKDSFIDLIRKMEKNIIFVFAYRPLDRHNFFNPETIKSTPAKLSMLNLAEVRNEFNFGLEFLKVRRNTDVFRVGKADYYNEAVPVLPSF